MRIRSFYQPIVLRRVVMLAAAALILASADPVAAQSLRPGMGSVPYADANGTGVTFRVWAPGASGITVAGMFNGWNTTSHHLVRESVTSGYWSADIASASVGDTYKYVVDGRWKADPFGRAYDGGPTANSVVIHPPPPVDDGFVAPPLHEMVIYQLHIGTFCDATPTNGHPGTFYDAVSCLDWITNMGFNAIQLMPVNEFPGEYSWGYNPLSQLAIESSYGGLEGLRTFVSESHARGLAVLGDMVINHMGDTNYYQFDLWGFDDPADGGSYFYRDDRRATPWGPRPDYDAPVVREMILEGVRVLMDAGLDGIRWDSPHTIFVDQQRRRISAATNLMLDAVSIIRSNAGISIAENGYPILTDGFDAQWVYSNRAVVLENYTYGPRWPGLYIGVRSYDPGQLAIIESHDTCGELNSAVRNPVQLAAGHAGDDDRTRRANMMFMASMMFSRGTPMMFMGTESGETNVWGDQILRMRTNNVMTTFTRDIIRLRRNLDGISPGLTSDQAWLPGGIFYNNGYHMMRGTGTQAVFTLYNYLSTTSYQATHLTETGHWFRVFSTDDAAYGGLDRGAAYFNITNSANGVKLYIPPYTAVMYAQTVPPGDYDNDGLPNAWEFAYFNNPTNADAEADADLDGMSEAHEFAAGTDPTRADSVLAIRSMTMTGQGIEIVWSAGSGADARLWATADLGSSWMPDASSSEGGSTFTNLIDSAPEQPGCRFFRIATMGTAPVHED